MCLGASRRAFFLVTNDATVCHPQRSSRIALAALAARAVGRPRQACLGIEMLLTFVATQLSISVALVVLFGFLLANVPIRRIGQNSGSGYNTRILGYDSARGEFSLLATFCIFAPLLLPVPFLPPAMILLLGIAALLFCVWHFSRLGVSHPGGPRAHRILREPQWADKTWKMDAGWRCAIAEESHEFTRKAVNNGHTLSGEAAGRQIWHQSQGVMVVEGREVRVPAPTKGASFSFNPSKNPNVEDAIWRAQRVAEWEANGGSVPDGRWKPRSALDACRKALAWYSILQARHLLTPPALRPPSHTCARPV